MAKYKKLITMLLGIFFAYAASADIKQEIASLEKNKQQKTKNQTVPAINHTLPNGKRVNLNDWQLVVFMQSTCQYCREFDPIIKKTADNLGLKTFVFSFDGMSDGAFDLVYPVNKSIVAAFYRDLPVATPTTFLVNIHTIVTAPVSQGKMAAPDFLSRINNTLTALLEMK